ncbi:hypothetical protein HJFPF1_00213 [Paramyrothecium foliicola]|nr:hypothetical protein HJFPF1_00213 [Paramyrothecium foliicola]
MAYSTPLDTFWRAGKEPISEIFERIATSMTNEMRSPRHTPYRGESGSDARYGSDAYDRLTMVGLAEVPTTLYKIKWPWIILQSVFFVGGSVFCSLTIKFSIQSRAAIPSFKSSALGTMSQSFIGANVLAGATTLTELNNRAEGGSVILFPIAREELIQLNDRGP